MPFGSCVALASVRARPNAVRRHTVAMASDKPLTLYTSTTPNGWKATVFLEELGVPYEIKPIAITKNEQKQPEFLKINPNGRIPALVDNEAGGIRVFESGAILLYLAEKYKSDLLPTEPADKAETLSWLMWQMGGLGPMQGQANHFVRYAPVKVEYGQNRYVNETRRLYQVMDDHLADKEYLAAGKYTIADIACFPWVLTGLPPNLPEEGLQERWYDRVFEREAVRKGCELPERSTFMDALKDPEKMKEVVAQAQAMMVSANAPSK